MPAVRFSTRFWDEREGAIAPNPLLGPDRRIRLAPMGLNADARTRTPPATCNEHGAWNRAGNRVPFDGPGLLRRQRIARRKPPRRPRPARRARPRLQLTTAPSRRIEHGRIQRLRNRSAGSTIRRAEEVRRRRERGVRPKIRRREADHEVRNGSGGGHDPAVSGVWRATVLARWRGVGHEGTAIRAHHLVNQIIKRVRGDGDRDGRDDIRPRPLVWRFGSPCHDDGLAVLPRRSRRRVARQADVDLARRDPFHPEPERRLGWLHADRVDALVRGLQVASRHQPRG